MPFRTIRDLGDEITPDYFLAIDEADKKAVIDQEGDLVFFLPPSLGFNIHAAQLDQILIDIARMMEASHARGFERGMYSGKQAVRTELHALLGIDRITAGLEVIAFGLERIADQGQRI